MVCSNNPAFFIPNIEYSYEEFERLALNAAVTNNTTPGYTDVVLRMSTDDELRVAMNISPRGVASLRTQLGKILSELLDSLPPTRTSLTPEQEHGVFLVDFINGIDWPSNEKSPVIGLGSSSVAG